MVTLCPYCRKVINDVVTVISSIQQRLYVDHVDGKYMVSYNEGLDWEEMNKDGLYAYFDADNVLGPWKFSRYSKIFDSHFFWTTCEDHRQWDDLLRTFCLVGDHLDSEHDLPMLVFKGGKKMTPNFWLQLNAMVIENVIHD